ncbi:uncharacterized protein P174DRAFT_252006 [Aspergillus novofumigatus IBT 16806]|uniref:Uncharacterized protein n=1 Tax=Aspergillus novofumigatus (strain IBT 16806) TaxID=1392255 RepID=A0A2I1C2L8_ASPN1|nr:uncharacterized protein P174DRAFT_252006 [Aspergillus novofumigatus IBT 16806]PKX91862.1 hypothetical protein P174DRAFT_252006 [Aspergillus novofumigatus IBT 16806]
MCVSAATWRLLSNVGLSHWSTLTHSTVIRWLCSIPSNLLSNSDSLGFPLSIEPWRGAGMQSSEAKWQNSWLKIYHFGTMRGQLSSSRKVGLEARTVRSIVHQRTFPQRL